MFKLTLGKQSFTGRRKFAGPSLPVQTGPATGDIGEWGATHITDTTSPAAATYNAGSCHREIWVISVIVHNFPLGLRVEYSSPIRLLIWKLLSIPPINYKRHTLFTFKNIVLVQKTYKREIERGEMEIVISRAVGSATWTHSIWNGVTRSGKMAAAPTTAGKCSAITCSSLVFHFPPFYFNNEIYNPNDCLFV